MKILHLSDTHMLPPGEELFGVDPAKRLKACVKHINKHHLDAELCVITGDLANKGQVSAYENLKEVLNDLLVPVRFLLGNHDRRLSFKSVFKGEDCDENGYIQSVWDKDKYRLIFLDTKDDNPGHQGRFCAKRLAWLRKVFPETKERVVLFMHHPWFPLGIPSVDCIGVQNSPGLQEFIKENQGQIHHLVFGHYHRYISGAWCGIAFHTINALAHQIALELNDPTRVAGSHEEPAYGVINFNESGTVIWQCHFLRDAYDFWIDH